MKELDFDSFLARDMISLDEACSCCEAILDGLEYSYKRKKKKVDKETKKD